SSPTPARSASGTRGADRKATAMGHRRGQRANGAGLLVLGLALSLAGLARGADQEPDLTPAERQKLEAQAMEGHQRLVRFYGARKLPEALNEAQQFLTIEQRLHPHAQYPDGHPQLAHSLNHLGAVLEAMGRPEAALGYFEQALAMYRRLYPASQYPAGHPDLAQSLNNLGFVLESMGRYEAAL